MYIAEEEKQRLERVASRGREEVRDSDVISGAI